jgi:hypothetical protein
VSTPATGADVRLLMPILNPATNTTAYQVVRYYRNATTNSLLRDGPQVNNDGTLNSTTADNGRLVMNNVAAFSTTVSPDCAWATINVTLTLPGTSTTQARVLSLYSGADLSIT